MHVRYTVYAGFIFVFLLVIVTLSYISRDINGERPGVSYYPLDDSYIHLVYVRSLSETGLPCYNDGEMESGMSSPLWVIIQAPFYAVCSRMWSNPTVSGRLLECLLALLLALLVMRLVGREWGILAGAIGGGLSLIDPALCFTRLSGMGIMLTGVVIVLSLLAWQERRFSALGWLLGLSVLARPENFLLGLVLGSGMVYEVSRSRVKAKELIKAGIPALILPGLWVCYNLAVTGKPLPNTFYAKFSTGVPAFSQFFGIIWHGILPVWSLGIFTGSILYVTGAIVWLRRNPFVWPVVIFPWIFILGMTASRPFYDYRDFCFARYIIPVFPVMLATASAGIGWLVRMDFSSGRCRWWLVVMAFLISLPALVLLPVKLDRAADEFAWNCDNIEDIQVRLGRWVRENTSSGDLIAVKDAGAIRFYGDRYTIDLMGLNTHQMLNVKDALGYLRERNPGYYVLPSEAQKPGQDHPGGERIEYLGGRSYARLFPVYQAWAENYTITNHFPNMQIIYRARYVR